MNKEPDRNQRKALGKGLSALLPARNKAEEPARTSTRAAAAAASLDKTQSLPEQFEEFQSIPLDRIEPDEDQPREQFDQEKLEELARSIEAHGVIQPITVRKTEAGKYCIIAGERRWRAAELAGLKTIPALVRTVHQHQLLELALVENIQREDLNPLEIAAALARLGLDYHLNHDEIARRTGKDRSTVTNFIRLLRLSDQVKEDLISGAITMGHARALLNVQDEDEQAEMCASIKARGLSVRQTEAWVKQVSERQKGGQAVDTKGSSDKKKEEVDPNVRAAVDEMSAALGTRVKLIARNEKAGRLEIEYYSAEDLERIYSVIVRG
ncbi:MAG TPA: ParB/RepB/Spo0J family partition protein [Bryobacteraceae bacterium]|jgi:ParB family chromosome partitioning protein|nr:ParB/RepB/Spo0J family partition protein [Bryobacteraceae bacterium]